MSSVRDEALRLLAAGLSIVPIKADGSKAPPFSWKREQTHALTRATAIALFEGSRYGLALVCGAVSGHLECIDFDSMEAFAAWTPLIPVDLRDRLVFCSTPGPGMQAWYRNVEPVPGNTKLARRPKATGWEVLIETRGGGGYAIIPPSPGACHPSGRPYEMAQGDFGALPELLADERTALIEAARGLNEYEEAPKPERPVESAPRASTPDGELTPMEDYNARGSWTELLMKHDWAIESWRGDVSYWKRPGKDEEGHSASLGHVAPGILYVFSSNAYPFESEKTYDLFGAKARLEYGGDFKECTRALRAEGFGSVQETVTLKRPKGNGSQSAHGETETAQEGKELSPTQAKRRAEMEAEQQIISAPELMAKRFDPLRWAVPNMIPEGLSILAGGTKTGKSWLALHIALAVASGGAVFGKIKVPKGEALYLALEDSQRRLRDRLEKSLMGAPPPPGLHMVTHWNLLGSGFSEQLDGWLQEHPTCRLVIVDVLQKVRPPRRSAGMEYQEDYMVTNALQQVPREHRCAMVVLHHTRKMTAPDPVDMVSGSVGITGGADSILVLMRQRDQKDATLHTISREADCDAMALEWDGDICCWKLVGKAADHRLTGERKQVMEFLKKSPTPIKPSELAGVLNKNVAAIQFLLGQLADEGVITKLGYGKYGMSEMQRIGSA